MSKMQHFYTLRSRLLRDREIHLARLGTIRETEAEWTLLRGYLLGIDHAIKSLEITLKQAGGHGQQTFF
jgi:hypothetical protein